MFSLIRSFFAEAPDFGENYWRRIILTTRGALPLGLTIHAVWAIVFWLIDQPELAFFNLASTLLWALAARVAFSDNSLTLGRLHIFVVLISFIEVPAHAVFATVMAGPEAGFHLYILLCLTVVPLLMYLSLRTRIILALFLTILFLCAYLLPNFVSPLSPMSEIETIWFGVTNAVSIPVIIAVMMMMLARATDQAERKLALERKRADDLLLNILPQEIAEKLKASPDVIAEEVPDATILFADIVGFTKASSQMTPADLVRRLNLVFTAFDGLVEKHGVEKIKTIGDAYMVAAGLPIPREDHAQVIARLARDMLDEVESLNRTLDGEPIRIRIGINSGPVVAGVIGRSKFAYDLWGDAVNVAARMEQISEAGEARLTDRTRNLLAADFACEDRGVVDVKGKGPMQVWALTKD